jgi:hypothetical protein
MKSKPPKHDETGNRYGNLRVIRYAGRTNRGLALWLCKCKCGNEKVIRIGSLQSGATKNCGCRLGHKFSNMLGNRFGKLTVLKHTGFFKSHAVWLCRCDCGKEQTVVGYHLRRGDTKTCGCTHPRQTHGLSKSRLPEYSVWRNMRQRCRNANNFDYHNYGSRGIDVCKRWEDFGDFLSDMGPRPSPKHQIDRIDNNRGYEPENCRWVVCKKNNRNRNNNRLVSYRGETRCVTEWAEIVGLSAGTLWNRLKRGWPVERALTETLNKSKSHRT